MVRGDTEFAYPIGECVFPVINKDFTLKLNNGGLALQWGDNGTADHNCELVVDGTAVRLRNANSGKVLGVQNMSTADNAVVLQWSDDGTADHRWTAQTSPRHLVTGLPQ